MSLPEIRYPGQLPESVPLLSQDQLEEITAGYEAVIVMLTNVANFAGRKVYFELVCKAVDGDPLAVEQLLEIQQALKRCAGDKPEGQPLGHRKKGKRPGGQSGISPGFY